MVSAQEYTVTPRSAEALVVDALAESPVVVLEGAKQVGKSALAEEVARRLSIPTVLTLDDATVRSSATFDPVGFVAGLVRPAVLDEVHRVPDLVSVILDVLDTDRRPGQFLLTSWAHDLVAPKANDVEPDMVKAITLWPLAQSEIERSSTNVVDALFAGSPPLVQEADLGRAAFWERAVRGGYPEARLRDGRSRGRWFSNYLDAMLQRDLRTISNRRRLDEMPRLLRILARHSAGVLNTRELARSLTVGHETVQDYIHLLETVFLVHRLPAWRPGLSARETRSPKAYLVDTGLLSHLLGADHDRIRDDPHVTATIFETFVAMELVKHAAWSTAAASLYHWRDGPDEVDIVLEKAAGRIVGIEATASATIRPDDARCLAKLRDRIGDRFIAGMVVYTGDRTLPLGDRLWAVPVSSLWSE